MQLITPAIAVLILGAGHALADQPKYCYIDKTNKFNNYKYKYIDVSPECKKHNIDSTGCCITLIPAVAPGPPLSDKAFIGDLKNAISQQITKDGYFKTSTAGRWTCGFSALTTAIKNRAIGEAYAEGLDRLSAGNPPTGGLGAADGLSAVGSLVGNALTQLQTIDTNWQMQQVYLVGDYSLISCTYSHPSVIG